jgi:chitinase
MHRIILLALTGALATISAGAFAATRAASPIVVGYVFSQNRALEHGEIDARRLNRINYAFANIQDGQMVTGFAEDAKNFALLQELKRQNPSLQVLVSVGGWLWSTNFSEVSLTPDSRKVFVQSVIEFLQQFELDGLDVDWEYPGMTGAGHPFREQDKENFTRLLKELRQRFDRETKRTHRKLYLSIAAGASVEYLDHVEMRKVQRYVDTINLMAYDYYEPGSDKTTGHHAPLFRSDADPKRISGDGSVKAMERAGVPAAKILLGVPFYGHVWSEVDDVNHGLFRQGAKASAGYASYAVITTTMLGHGFTRYWDPIASVPYLYSPDKKLFVSYEDGQSLAVKCKYVLTRKLGGVMFWDYAGDPSGTLLKTIDQSLHDEGADRGSEQ